MKTAFYFEVEDLSALIAEFVRTLKEYTYSPGFIGEALGIILNGLYHLQVNKEHEEDAD